MAAPITSLPSSTKKPGTYLELDTSGRKRGITPTAKRVMHVGAKLSAGTQAILTPIQVYSEKEADAYFGQGSELALMLRAAMRQARREGASPELYAVAVTDATGTAKTATFTVTGAATEAGDIVFHVRGRTIRAGVKVGDSVTAMAAAMVDAVKADYDEMPVTAASSLGVMTLTARHANLNSGLIKTTANGAVLAPPGVSVAVAAGATAATAYDITTALDACVGAYYHAYVVYGDTAAILDDLEAHLDVMGAPAAKKWGMAFMASASSIATADALADGTGANDGNRKDITLISQENAQDLPGSIAACFAIAVKAREDTSVHLNGHQLEVFGSPDDASLYLDSEIESCLAAGLTPLTVDRGATKIVKWVTTQVLDSSGAVPFFLCAEGNVVETLFWLGEQVDITCTLFQGIDANKKGTTATANRLRGTIYALLKEAEGLERLHNVDAHKAEIIVQDHPTLTDRYEVDIPATVVPGLHQVSGKLSLILE